VTNTTTTTNTAAPVDAPTPRTVAERQAADGVAAIRAARAKRRDGATAPLAADAVRVPLAERFGAGATVDVVPRWRGAALCIHAPMRDGVPTPTRGVWIVTSTAYGYAAGTYRGPLAAAVKLARLWDAEFGAALDAAPMGPAGVPTLAEWPQARAWSRQVDGNAPASGPVDADHGDYRRDTDARGDNGRHIGDGAAAPTLPQLRADAAAGRPVSLAALARAKRRDAATVPLAIAADIARVHTGAPMRHNATSEPPRREPVAAADGDGAEQYPATVTLSAVVVDGERRVRYARRLPDGRERLRTPDGRAVRMSGDVAAFADGAGVRLRLWFASAWRDVPSIAECMEWTLDGVAETPDGSRVEPDAADSWLSLLGLN
jgi:hypothetical protein